jgi:hypothetical protein
MEAKPASIHPRASRFTAKTKTENKNKHNFISKNKIDDKNSRKLRSHLGVTLIQTEGMQQLYINSTSFFFH